MKRGKDQEKTMGPMFPRLHVNDTEKGGPRAPPRNKMALYEQLSIPSQRFNGGALPLNPNSTVNSVPPSSSSHEGARERGSFFRLQQPHSVHPADKTIERHSDLNNQPVQQEQKKKPEEDDFRVPIFVQQSGISPNPSGNHQNIDNEGRSSHLPSIQDASAIKNSWGVAAKSASSQSSRQRLKETNGSPRFGHGNVWNDSSRLQHNGNLRDYVVDSQAVNINMVRNEATRARGYVNSSPPLRDIQQEIVRSPNDPNNCDAVSETSIVDSISAVDISPDDVVGIIGQKHFWKARRAIVNQQRAFAIQVFELHRLIKVQRLIAGSPKLLGEDDAYLGKPVKVFPVKKIPLEYVLKPTPNVPKLKDDREKPNDGMEFSAENAVAKVSLSSVQNGSQTTNCRPFSAYTLPPHDPKMGAWSFNHPPGHQWLIPVMTPSEGLVYKPYPGPGFMNPVCGGCGPPGSAPPIGHNFVNYGVPPHPLHQHHFGPASHVYFPPYGMSTTNQNPNPSISSSGAEETNPVHPQAVPNVVNIDARKDSEVQASTASSRSKRTQGRNASPLLPPSPPAEGGERPPQDTEPARVIRVVPRNGQSATDSVARIFQSIQEERKQYDSV